MGVLPKTYPMILYFGRAVNEGDGIASADVMVNSTSVRAKCKTSDATLQRSGADELIIIISNYFSANGSNHNKRMNVNSGVAWTRPLSCASVECRFVTFVTGIVQSMVVSKLHGQDAHATLEPAGTAH